MFLSPDTVAHDSRVELWREFDASFGRLCALLPSARDAAEIRAAAKDSGLVLSEGVSEDLRAGFRRAASWRSAPVDPVTGGVIAFWVKRKTGDEPICLKEQRGMVIVWNDREQRFYLYDCMDRRCFASTTFADFLKEIEALPRLIKIEEPQTCTAPLSWKMPPGEREKLMRIIERGRRTVVPGEFTTCTCESDGLRFPDGALVTH